MDRIMEITRRHELAVIENVAQCPGGGWTSDRRLGSLGDIGVFSFNLYKLITSGEGGAFITNRRDLYERGGIFHDSGSIFRSTAEEISEPLFPGINLRSSDITGAIMRVQHGRMDGIIADLKRIRGHVADAVAAAIDLEPIPYNGGMETGTGAVLGYQFPDAATARAFNDQVFAALDRLPPVVSVPCGVPLDSDKHIYTDWEVVLEKRGGHSDSVNPFLHPANADSPVEYSLDMLPRPLDVLTRTVKVPINSDWRSRRIRSSPRSATPRHDGKPRRLLMTQPSERASIQALTRR